VKFHRTPRPQARSHSFGLGGGSVEMVGKPFDASDLLGKGGLEVYRRERERELQD
jgi:hypothetical protein